MCAKFDLCLVSDKRVHQIETGICPHKTQTQAKLLVFVSPASVWPGNSISFISAINPRLCFIFPCSESKVHILYRQTNILQYMSDRIFSRLTKKQSCLVKDTFALMMYNVDIALLLPSLFNQIYRPGVSLVCVNQEIPESLADFLLSQPWLSTNYLHLGEETYKLF